MDPNTPSPTPGPRDPGLQPERTSLAWRRTGLGAVAAALVMARVAALRDAPTVAAISLVLAVVAIAALLEGSTRHRGRADRFARADTSGGLSLAARTAVVAVVALAVIGVVLTLAT